MAQWAKMPAANLRDKNLILRTYTIKGEDWFPASYILTLTSTAHHVYTHIHTPNKIPLPTQGIYIAFESVVLQTYLVELNLTAPGYMGFYSTRNVYSRDGVYQLYVEILFNPHC